MVKATSSAVRVVVRVRPLNAREINRNAKCLIHMNAQTEATSIYPPDEADAGNTRASRRKLDECKTFTYDKSLWSVDPNDPHYADQSALHEFLGKEFVRHAFDGYNCCIFAYGQTGSGKTHSMMGTPTGPGLIPQICTEIFDTIEATRQTTFKVSINYYEIYNETATDLLLARDPKERAKPLKVRESPTSGPYLEGLSEFQVKSYEDIQAFMQVGNQARRTASTKMNDTSSRSHAVFTLTINQRSTDGLGVEKTSRFRLVDLAGSERASATGASGDRLREGANINKSLTTLGRVISKLAEPVRTGMVPYRDSTLTWLLSDSLGGNSKTAMIACISPADYDETVTTLRYADAVKHISTNAVVNETRDHADSRRLDAELKEMSKLLSLTQREKAELQQYEHQAKSLYDAVTNITETTQLRIDSLEQENAALRMHLRLAIEALRNPIDIPAESETEDEITPIEGIAQLEADIQSLQAQVSSFAGQVRHDRVILV